jgi:hypothetical protein
LDQAVAAFQAANSAPYYLDVDGEDGRLVYRRGPLTLLPATVGLIFGDVVQNLRACLDHIIYAISLRATSDPAGCEFPIFEYPTTGPDHRGFDPYGRRKTRFLPAEVQDVVESLQPYYPLIPSVTRPFVRHPLWDLHQIANIDKHRQIPLLVTVAEAQMVEVQAPTPLTENPLPPVHWFGPALRENDPIVSVPLPRDDLSFKPSITVQVMIDAPGISPQPVVTLSRRLVEHVSWVVGRMRPYL